MQIENNYSMMKSEEMQYIFSRSPHGMIKWGSTLIGGIIAVLFICSFFFHYPDTINCNVSLTTFDSQSWIIAKTTGKIEELYHIDRQYVKAGSIIAVIKNRANTKEILKLVNLLNTIQVDGHQIRNIRVNKTYLGDIQSEYCAFIKILEKYNNSLRYNSSEQEQISKEDSLKMIYKKLYRAIKKWENKYVLVSKSSGILSYNGNLRDIQYITKDDKVFSVFDNENKCIYGRIQIPIAGISNVKIGQIVNIKIKGYSYIEYGLLRGRLISISPILKKGVYFGIVELPAHLVTTFHKSIPLFIGEAEGSADIVISNMSIGERIFTPFKYIIRSCVFK